MAAIPPEYGGARVFATGKTDALTTAGDLAAASLQALYAIHESGSIAASHRPALLQAGENLKLVLKNADEILERERDTRVQCPLTKIPAEDYGDGDDLSRVRLQNVTFFDGNNPDPGEVSRWLNKVLNTAKGHKLKLDSVIQLLIQASSGTACDYIEQMRDEGKSLGEVIALLEMRYGCLCSEEEAIVKCNSLEREPGAPLSKFLDKLRHMARIACRYEKDDKVRIEKINQLVVSNVRRALPISIRSELENRLLARKRMGVKVFESWEIENECTELERMRLERKREAAKVVAALQSQKKGGKFVNMAALFEAQQELLELGDVGEALSVLQVGQGSPDLSPIASDEEEERDVFLARQIHRERKKFQSAGKPVDEQRVMKGAVRKYNERYGGPRNWNKQRVVGGVVHQAPGQPQGQFSGGQRYPQQASAPPHAAPQPPLAQDELRNRPIYELLTLSKCPKGHCLQCGLRGHVLGRDECPLKDKPLVNSPCVSCGMGLHPSNECIKTYIEGRANLVAGQQQPYLNE